MTQANTSSSRNISCFLALLVAFSLAAAPVTAWAADEDDAHEQYLKGVEAASEEKYEEALEYFKEAEELGAPSAVLYNIAKCYDHLGQFHLALDYYEEYVEQPKVKKQVKKKGLKKRIEEIKVMPSVIKFVTEPPGCEVHEELEDGTTERIGITPLEKTVEQGEHVFLITKEDYEEETVEINALNGEPFDIDIEMAPVEGTEPEKEEEVDEDEEEVEKKKRDKPVGIYLELGGGLALHPYTYVQYTEPPPGTDVHNNKFKAGADTSFGAGWRYNFKDDMGIGAGLRVNFRTYKIEDTEMTSGDSVNADSLFVTLLAVPSFHWEFHEILTLEASLPLGLAWLVPMGKIDEDVRVNL
ncbi:MAG: hypothetical protein JRG91_17335, partial [Deltaproteobacteria bacterium]|nr:hypothetical protein [Deltaproteobacteria bacterium]